MSIVSSNTQQENKKQPVEEKMINSLKSEKGAIIDGKELDH